jgi:hypothetical protein
VTSKIERRKRDFRGHDIVLRCSPRGRDYHARARCKPSGISLNLAEDFLQPKPCRMSEPELLFGGRGSASAECRHGPREQSVGQPATLCLEPPNASRLRTPLFVDLAATARRDYEPSSLCRPQFLHKTTAWVICSGAAITRSVAQYPHTKRMPLAESTTTGGASATLTGGGIEVTRRARSSIVASVRSGSPAPVDTWT